MTQGRKDCRTKQACEPRDLAEAIYCVVHHSDVDMRQIAAAAGIRPGYLSDAANPDREETQFQARMITPVTQASKNHAIVELLCRENGGVFVPVPHIDPEHDDILRAHLAAVREFGEQAAHLEAALNPKGDGGSSITREEAADFALEVDQCIAKLVAMKVIVARAAGKL